MALTGISDAEHNRLLDKLTRRTDKTSTTDAQFKKLTELHG